MTSRALTTGERQIAQLVFGNRIDYDLVLIHDYKYPPADLPFNLGQEDDEAVTPNGEIYFPPGHFKVDFSTESEDLQGWFIHEMGHVLQHQNGMNVILQRIQDGGDYNFDDIFNGKAFHELPMEAQAEFLEKYYRKLIDQAPDLDDYKARLPMDLPGAAPGEGTTADLNDPGRDLPAVIPGTLPQKLAPTDIPGIAPGPTGIGGGGLEPLVFDLNASGTIDLLPLEDGIHFDFWGDGFAEQVGWAAPEDGMLAIDLDESGTIDNVSELFGSQFPLTYLVEDNFDAFINEENGFAKLAKYDLVVNGGNNDGAITSADDIWSDLIIWQDANSDGVSQSGEMLTLGSLGITSIDVSDYELESFSGGGSGGFGRVIEGNIVTHTGTFTMGGVEREVVDVWFDSDLLNTAYVSDYTLDERVMFMPNIRGYGMIPDLYIAMSLDEDLLDDVSDFITGHSFGELFDGVSSDTESIMLKSAGLDAANLPNFDYSKHGMFEELKEYWFLRKFMGQDNDGLGTWFDQSPYLPYVSEGVAAIQEAYGNLLESFAAKLIFQSGGSQLFEEGAIYSPYEDTFKGTFALSQEAVDDLETAAGTSGDAEAYWRAVAKFIDNTMGISELSGTEIGWLDDAVDDSTSGALGWSDIVALLDAQIIGGTNGSDTINGTDYDDAIYGDDLSDPYLDTGNDILNGGAGNDRLFGGEQGSNGTNDTLNGGVGNDYLEGGWGADTYVYDYGHDVIFDVSTYNDTDIIELASGINEADVTIHYARMDSIAGHLFLEIAGRGTITIQTQYMVDPITLIDEIHFANSAVWTLDTAPIHLHGTYRTDGVTATGFTGDDFLYGYGGDDIMSGYTGDDTFDGGAGDDDMRGDVGDDTYIVSAGSDIVRETDGEDTIFIPEGYTLDDISFLRVNDNSVRIVVDGLGDITVLDHFYGSGKEVETLKFFGGAETDLLTYVFTTVGTSGSDFLQGTNASWPQQDDIYLFGTGTDEVYEYGGTDTLLFGAGVTPGSITVSRVTGFNFANLQFADGSGNTITFLNHFSDVANMERLERVEFANSTVWNLSQMEVQTIGTSGADSIFCYDLGDASANDIVFAYADADQVTGAAGNDEIHGGDGDDYYLGGGTGNDLIYGDDGNDALYGEADNDILIGGAGNDTIDGGSENDTVSYSTAGSAVTVNLATATAQNTGGAGTDTIANTENLIGSGYNDTLTGDGNANTLEGGAGNDTINGAGGTDTVSYEGAGSAVTVNLATATGQNTGGAGTDTITNIENLRGSAYNDTLTGTTGNNTIEGGAGNDTINAQGGTDTLTYANAAGAVTVSLALATAQNTVSAGTDTVSNFENLIGSAFGDTLTGSTAANTINGGDGNDVIEGGAGNDTLVGGNGTDTVSFASAASATTFNLATTSGQNTVSSGTDTVSGFENIIGSAFNDTLTGDGSANVIEGGAGNDTINGAGGNDTVSYATAGSAVTVNLTTTTGQNTVGAGTDTITNTENLTGSAFNDTLTGNTVDNIIDGGSGNDTIQGGTGNDTLVGGLGTDTVTYAAAASGITFNLATLSAQNTGGAGTDTVSGFENVTGSASADTLTGDANANVIDGGAGNDTIEGGDGNDTLTGGSNTDTLIYGSATAGITISLALGTAQNTGGAGTDTVSGFENLTGSAYTDVLTGDANANTINGGDGDDVIEGGAGNDTLVGGNGTDTVSFANAASATTFNLATTSGQNTVSSGTDTVSGFENVKGSAFNDTLTGNSSNNTIEGGAGNDTINGSGGTDTLSYASAGSAVTVNLSTATAQNTVGAGTDTISSMENLTGSGFNDTLTGTSSANTIIGGAGNDTISAGGGNDILYGGAGADTMTGSTGGDVFMFENATAFGASDTIADFSTAQVDILDISDILDLYNSATDDISNFVRITDNGTNSFLSVDADGGGNSFTQIAQLSGVTNLAAGATATELELDTLIANGTLLAA